MRDVCHVEMKRCRNVCGNLTKKFPVNFYIWPLYFNRLDVKSKDMYCHEIICNVKTKSLSNGTAYAT